MLFLLLACRPDPGAPSYPDRMGLILDTADTNFLSGPDPYQDGDKRLSLGIFYEGGYSDLIPVDDVTVFYYIYNNYTETTDPDDRVEGYVSAVWTISGQTWFGGGVNATVPVDLSAWDTLHFSVKGLPTETITDLSVNVETAAGSTGVDLFGEGFAMDNTWHTFSFPLSTFSTDFTETNGLFVMVSDAGAGGDAIKIDNLYFTAE